MNTNMNMQSNSVSDNFIVSAVAVFLDAETATYTSRKLAIPVQKDLSELQDFDTILDFLMDIEPEAFSFHEISIRAVYIKH